MELIVGKKYKNKNSTNVIEITAIGKRFALCLNSLNEEVMTSKSYIKQSYEEYKEPRKGTVWVNIYSYKDGQVWATTKHTEEEADKAPEYTSSSRIACVEVPWTEGGGL